MCVCVCVCVYVCVYVCACECVHFHSKRSGRTGSSKPPNFFEAPVQPSTNLGGDGPEGTMKEVDIIQHCIDREKARQVKDYTEADRIRKFCSLKIFVCCLCGFAPNTNVLSTHPHTHRRMQAKHQKRKQSKQS